MRRLAGRVEVYFEATGADERLRELHRRLRRPRVDGRAEAPSGAHVVLRVGRAASESAAVALAARWLERNGHELASLDARKLVEFRTFFARDDGSRLLILSPEICRLAARTECALGIQACRSDERTAGSRRT